MSVSFVVFSMISLAVAMLEFARTKRTGPDLLSLFILMFAVQILIPGIAISLILAATPPPVTGLPFFDRIYGDLSTAEVLISAALTAFFVFSLYIAFLATTGGWRQRCRLPTTSITLHKGKVWSVVAIGLLSSLILLRQLSPNGLSEGYRALILFRAQDPSVYKPSFLTANLFALTQTFALFSILTITTNYKRHRLGTFFCALAVVGFLGVMTASRRGIALQALLVCFAFMLARKKWYVGIATVLFAICFPLLVFGKSFLALLATGRTFAEIVEGLAGADFVGSILAGMSYLGMTLTSSWATLMYLDIPIRFGVDHLLSALRFLPLGFLGYDESTIFPERIVRISTAAFVGEDQLDIPPGLLGAMWLDGWIFGPIVWGIIYGSVIGLMHSAYNRIENSIEAAGVFVILLFVVALPLNTGSLDFNFSVDMLFLLIFAGCAVKIRKRGPLKAGRVHVAPVSAAQDVPKE